MFINSGSIGKIPGALKVKSRSIKAPGIFNREYSPKMKIPGVNPSIILGAAHVFVAFLQINTKLYVKKNRSARLLKGPQTDNLSVKQYKNC
ncbi:hypothetical protein NQ315_009210 [Exocentrus adspersus]|uniref:Uncharacterized protein n=1 Tax=Exocentrus adspersus TaxID=1586481 RepID=A0AAV8WFR8_9CUCU|nr:hypothetical protein NQ315_009210 [Exocentrus adspersus]